MKKIEELKQKRKDGTQTHVIINENRNKLVIISLFDSCYPRKYFFFSFINHFFGFFVFKVSQYYVKELPHEYNNKDQFNFMVNNPIGPEWNSMRSTVQMIKPKIKSQPGNIIKPIEPPKTIKDKK